MKLTPVGIDIAKHVFQVHRVDEEAGEIVNKPIERAKFLEHFANRAPYMIGMEACGGAHHWARQLAKMGHQVKLMPAEFVKAFKIRNKNDAADAWANLAGSAAARLSNDTKSSEKCTKVVHFRFSRR
jgi:transposase